MTKYLPSINDYDEVKYDFLANKNSKFLFNLFNKNQEINGRKKVAVKHTKVSADDYALRTLQNRNWPYFVDRIIQFSQGVFDINDIITTDPEEVNILNNTRSNFEITKNLYNELLTAVGINLHEFFVNLGIEEKDKIDTDLTNNGYFSWDPNEVYVQNRILATYRDFFYDTGRFPGRYELIRLPTPIMLSFIRSNDWISPRSLYETYVGRDMQGKTSVQFLATFNRFLGGNVELSRNAMNEFFHNLSWQVLTNDNNSVQIKFEAITELVKSINFLLQKKIYESKKRTQEINAKIQDKLLEKEIAQIRTKNEQVEREIVKDILKNNTTDYTPQYTLPTVKTDAENERDKISENKNYITTELVRKERDIQIIDDITKKDKKDLIRSITDPADGILTNENITPSDWTRSDNNEPVQPQLDPGVINVMQQMVKIMSEQTAVLDSIRPPPQPLVNPSNNPIQITTQPDLQDTLTKETPDFTNITKLKDEIADVISTADTANTQPFQSDTDVPDIPPYWTENPDLYSEINLPSFVPDNIIPDIKLNYPTPNGNPEIDQRNLDDYYDTLQQIRPDAFISEDEDNVDAVIKTDIAIDNNQNIPLPNDDIIIIDGIKNEPDSEPEYKPYVDTDGNILVKTNKVRKNYIPKINKKNKIYRDKAKNKAILAKIKALRLKNNKEQYKTKVLAPTDTSNNEIGNPQVTTTIPPTILVYYIKVEDDIALTSDDDVTYVKYIPPPPEIPVPPPVHPRNRLKQQLTAPKSPEPMPDQFSDTETVNYIPIETDDVDVLADAELSDAETISYLLNLNLKNQIYRKRAKKKALKILAKKNILKNKIHKKRSNDIDFTVDIADSDDEVTYVKYIPPPSDVPVPPPTHPRDRLKRQTRVSEVDIETDDVVEILANPNVTTILPGQLKTEDDLIDYKPPVDILTSDSYVTDHVPLQLDTEKIILTDDGDVILTEPDNMQVSEGALVPISNNTVQLENDTNMGEIATRNIVLKRKQPDVSIANIKKTKDDTEISIQHPIFRKMQKQSILDKKIARILSQEKPIDIQVESDDLLAIEDAPTLPMLLPPPSSDDSQNLATVDSETLRMMPWIDFDVIMQNIDKNERERVIFDLLQANMPNIGEDLYYIDHDPTTNVFSIKKDILADEITDFTESIRVIDAKLRLETLTRQERNNLLRKRRLKISELRKTYEAHNLADVLDNRLSETEKQILEDKAVKLLTELNKEEDLYYYRFNNDTQEFEILLEDRDLRINAIVFAALQLKKVIKDPAISNSRRQFLKRELKNLLDYLDSKGARLLAASLR